jgi:hypothetical protein
MSRGEFAYESKGGDEEVAERHDEEGMELRF